MHKKPSFDLNSCPFKDTPKTNRRFNITSHPIAPGHKTQNPAYGVDSLAFQIKSQLFAHVFRFYGLSHAHSRNQASITCKDCPNTAIISKAKVWPRAFACNMQQRTGDKALSVVQRSVVFRFCTGRSEVAAVASPL